MYPARLVVIVAFPIYSWGLVVTFSPSACIGPHGNNYFLNYVQAAHVCPGLIFMVY